MAELVKALLGHTAGIVLLFVITLVIIAIAVVGVVLIWKKGKKLGPVELSNGVAASPVIKENSIVIEIETFKKLLSSVSEPIFKDYYRRNNDIETEYIRKVTKFQQEAIQQANDSMIVEFQTSSSERTKLNQETEFLKLYLDHDFNYHLRQSLDDLKIVDLTTWTDFEKTNKAQEAAKAAVVRLQANIAKYPVFERDLFVSIFAASITNIQETITKILNEYVKSQKDKQKQLEESTNEKIRFFEEKINAEVERYSK